MKSTSCPRLFLLLALVFFASGASCLHAQTRTVTRVAAVGSASYFLLDDGALYGAGQGAGVSGNATTYPAKITTGVKEVFAGKYGRIVFNIKTDGTLWALGDNSSGEFGNGTQTSSYSQPIQVATDVVSVAPGNNHTLFLKGDGTLWAAGLNDRGQFGTGTTSQRPALNPIQIMSNVKSMAAGYGTSFFIKSDNTLWGTGFNAYGQLGDGTPTNRFSPVLIATDVNAVDATSDLTTIFLRNDGSLYGMGYNYGGQLGIASGQQIRTPKLLASGASKAWVSSNHLFLLKADKTLYSIGNNEWSQFGTSRSPAARPPFKSPQA
jgi:alpha-tubulin suppressor-like RCC1 family protein